MYVVIYRAKINNSKKFTSKYYGNIVGINRNILEPKIQKKYNLNTSDVCYFHTDAEIPKLDNIEIDKVLNNARSVPKDS